MAREIFERGHAAAVLLYDPARDAVVLIEQFRPGAYAAGVNPWLVEVVAGIIEAGETPADVVQREAVGEARCRVPALHPHSPFFFQPAAYALTVALSPAAHATTPPGA